MAMINHFYFYLFDPEWGPAFIKTNAYAPFPAWIYLNGHEWAKRQLNKAKVAFEELDNGFLSCEDPAVLQRVCDRLGPGAVKSFFWRWQVRLPSPFTRQDLRRGILYDLAFRQIEFSDTRVFDRPQAGRAFFEGVIRDHLDLGRPEEVALLFDRRIQPRPPPSPAVSHQGAHPGRRPRHCFYYKSSRIKQYLILCSQRKKCSRHEDGYFVDMSLTHRPRGPNAWFRPRPGALREPVPADRGAVDFPAGDG